MESLDQQNEPLQTSSQAQKELPTNDETERKGVSFKGQANALLRKNLTYQKRRPCLNVCLILLPLVFVGMLIALQEVIDRELEKDRYTRCGCACMLCCDGFICREGTPEDPVFCQEYVEDCKIFNDDICDIEYSSPEQALFCGVEHPPSWPPAMTIPEERKRARPWNPNAAILWTGLESAAREMTEKYFLPALNFLNLLQAQEVAPFFSEQAEEGVFRGEALAITGFRFGSDADLVLSGYIEPAFASENLAFLTQDCGSIDLSLINNNLPRDFLESIEQLARSVIGDGIAPNGTQFVQCVETPLLELTKVEINRRLFCGFEEARCNATKEEQKQSNRKLLQFGDSSTELDEEGDFVEDRYSNAWDFTGTNESHFKVNIWYDRSYDDGGPPYHRRVNSPLDIAADSWVKWVLGEDFSAQLLGLQAVPKPATHLTLEFSTLLAVMFFAWIVQFMLPLMMVQLVYEKESNLRVMMKMHGLTDTAYWTINYLYYLVLFLTYSAVFVAISAIADLAIFTRNSYSVIAVFFLLFGNVQIVFAGSLSSIFTNSTTAMIFSILWVIITGLIGAFLFESLVERSRWFVYLIELIPAFGGYRVLYELSQYGFVATFSDGDGMTWSSLGDDNNHTRYVFLVLLFEWPLFSFLTWYLEQVLERGVGIGRHPLFFLDYFRKKSKSLNKIGSFGPTSSFKPEPDAFVSEDAEEERQRVGKMEREEMEEQGLIAYGLRKVFPSLDGNAEKVAVQDLTLAVRKGEVFGLLGPNGAGKTTSINMLIGFMSPSSGQATVSGYDISDDMDQIYTLMGVCPQHNLLWDSLTGIEHLLFHGRLKGLSGARLMAAADAALQSVNLFFGNVGKQQVHTYSGGMKRRLSVAISLIGSPKVVYLDEPSTGLDPASRKNLWNVVKSAKANKSIILTTHSMEEAEVLCDRLCIFVGGKIVVLGNPKHLIAKHGGYKVVTLTTKPELVSGISAHIENKFPEAKLTYSVGGTLKYELPSDRVKHSDVFHIMEMSQIQVDDWGVADATLEDVFIKIATQAGAYSEALA